MVNPIFHICFVILLLACGVYVFSKGFLLTRHEMSTKSACSTPGNLNNALSDENNSNFCWTVPAIGSLYKKVIFIVIDALRFDFAYFHPNAAKNIPYKNQLKVFRDLAVNYGCKSVRLFNFQADAPTTTMQRIKGMTTGSFPTFIDVSNNFDTPEITEDNLIDQILSHTNENITFLGDDTWIRLFPRRFKTAYAFPSFDVKNLHLVDDGIIDHLVPEIMKDNWKLLIAHFLGVDHCGHRYGPFHSEMSSKLQQMNNVIRSVVDNMQNDTLLLIMGDHGMTHTGDHGGETPDEINAALFAFSPVGKFSDTHLKFNENCYADLTYQVDLVPTLSLLLGVPIPFSNLGAVIPDLIPSDEVHHFLKDSGEVSTVLSNSLYVNAKQVENYLKEYNRLFENFNTPEFHKLMRKFAKLNKAHLPQEKEIHDLLRQARILCKQIWAQFNLASMSLGMCTITVVCIWLIRDDFSLKNYAYLLITLCLCLLIHLLENLAYQISVLIVLLIILSIYIMNLTYMSKATFPTLVCVCYPLLFTSNSFVMSEDSISMFICLSILLWSFIHITRLSVRSSMQVPTSRKNSKLYLKFKKKLLMFLSNLPFLYVIIASLILRVSFHFRICRPEQFWCFNNQTKQSTNEAIDINSKRESLYYIDDLIDFSDCWTRLFASGGSLVISLFIFTMLLKKEGNLRNLYSASVLCCTKLIPLATLCIIANWQIQTLPAKDLDMLPTFYVTFLPRCAYCLLFLCVVLWWVSPMTVHLLYQDRHGKYRHEFDPLTEERLVTQYYEKLKSEQEMSVKSMSAVIMEKIKQSTTEKQPPAAFGLYTFASAAVIGQGEVIVVLLAMLLEAKYAPILLLLLVYIGIVLEILSCLGRSHMVSWDAVAIWTLSSSFWWFATGHQASISSIPWKAAFVGFQGSHPTVLLPALMVGVNLFASQLIHTVLLPLLVLWPISRGKQLGSSVERPTKSGSISTADKFDNEMDFLQSSLSWDCFTGLFFKYITLQALKTLACMVAAFIHRRHLMVWQIFAPRYIYEVLSFFVVCTVSLFMYLFIWRVRRSLESWIKQIK